MSIAAGSLRHRVSIQRPVTVLDSSGDVVQNDDGTVALIWEEVDEVWAAIDPLSVREFIRASATQSQVTARITIRFRPGLDATMRIVHTPYGQSARIYNPAGFLPDKESGLDYLTIPCSEGTNDGE